MEVIVLAGGLGTRLRSVVPDLPKALSPVAGKPFLSYVIEYLTVQGVNHFVFSTGYLSQKIEQFLQDRYSHLHYSISKEDVPLGTGGAVKKALQLCDDSNVLVVNADTFFKVELAEMKEQHTYREADCTLALKHMFNFDRYGTVELSKDMISITSFQEKTFRKEGLINGGFTFIKKSALIDQELPEKFSFEKDFLEPNIARLRIKGFISNGYFIDIGVPFDYEKAQSDFK
jgi:D-glycero-alpha-D-manno-heptose 1-phosphate guanylyltransferase